MGLELSSELVSAVSCLSGKVHGRGQGSSPASFSESPARYPFGLFRETITALAPLRFPQVWSALVSRVPGCQICSLANLITLSLIANQSPVCYHCIRSVMCPITGLYTKLSLAVISAIVTNHMPRLFHQGFPWPMCGSQMQAVTGVLGHQRCHL